MILTWVRNDILLIGIVFCNKWLLPELSIVCFLPFFMFIGRAHTDEMCILYMMYYTGSESNAIYRECFGEANKDLKQSLPLDSDAILPPLPP